MSFSLIRTSKSLLKQSDSDEIECIHGIRSICSILLYVAHRLIPIGHVPFFNKINLTEVANNPTSIILRLSVIYTDSFLLLSGILTSYGMSKDIEEKGYIPWFSRIVARFIRLTPPFMFIILYYAYIMEYLGEGPLWNSVVVSNSKLCKEYWWRNFLYIQNFYPFQEMCATHSHQLALDMQLSLITPILVWFLYRRPFIGVTITIFLHSLSVILRYYTTLNHRLSLVIYHGISISQLYRTANFLYASSIHRATPYLAGVGLGVLLRQITPNFSIPKFLTIIGWLMAGYFAGWALYSPSHLSGQKYQYDAIEAAQFSALCSLAWALALSWLIFACFSDNNGYLNKILSSRPMILLSRISYTLYLTQFIVFFYNVGTIKNPTEFQIHTSISLNEMLIVLFISTLLTLIIDLPAQKIKTILLRTIQSKDNDDTIITENNIQKSTNTDELNDDKKTVHFNEVIEEHVLNDDDDDNKKLISQLSTESQSSVDEHDINNKKNDKLVVQLSTESQISEDLEEDHLDSQLSTEDEHFDDRDEISMEEELLIDEGHFDEQEDSSTIEEHDIESKTTKRQWFENDPEEEEEVVQKVTVRLSSNGKISVQEQIQQALDDENDK